MDFRSGVTTLSSLLNRVHHKFVKSSLTQFLFWLSIPVILWMIYQIKCFRDNHPLLYQLFWNIAFVLICLKAALKVVKFFFGAYRREREPMLSMSPAAADIGSKEESEQILDLDHLDEKLANWIKLLEATLTKYEDEKRLSAHQVEQIGQMRTAMASDFALIQALAQRIEALTAELNRLSPPTTPNLTPRNTQILLGASSGLMETNGEEFVSESLCPNMNQAQMQTADEYENENESAESAAQAQAQEVRIRFGYGIPRNHHHQTQLENSSREIHYWPAIPNAQPHPLCSFTPAQANAAMNSNPNWN